jgi:hypothetical protein
MVLPEVTDADDRYSERMAHAVGISVLSRPTIVIPASLADA